ncbi:MAG: hypothetical protein ACI835_005025 [Planctomycetota bacterium]|jgi:hypothetical protein
MPGKELVTESCVSRMASGGELVLGPTKIATPAALDAAFAKGIQVVYSDIDAPAMARAKSDLWQRMKSKDGTYVVQVKAGRAHVTRLSESGPTPFGEE